MSIRTTLTIEDDVYDRLRNEVRRTGKPLKEVVNNALRKGLARGSEDQRPTFRIRARDLGLRPGIELDDAEGLIERQACASRIRCRQQHAAQPKTPSYCIPRRLADRSRQRSTSTTV